MYSSFVRLWTMNSTQQKNILLRRRRNLFWDCIVGGPFFSSTILVILRSVVEDLFSPGKVETSDTSRKLSKVRSSFWILLSALFSGIFSNSAIVQIYTTWLLDYLSEESLLHLTKRHKDEIRMVHRSTYSSLNVSIEDLWVSRGYWATKGPDQNVEHNWIYWYFLRRLTFPKHFAIEIQNDV